MQPVTAWTTRNWPIPGDFVRVSVDKTGGEADYPYRLYQGDVRVLEFHAGPGTNKDEITNSAGETVWNYWADPYSTTKVEILSRAPFPWAHGYVLRAALFWPEPGEDPYGILGKTELEIYQSAVTLVASAFPGYWGIFEVRAHYRNQATTVPSAPDEGRSTLGEVIPEEWPVGACIDWSSIAEALIVEAPTSELEILDWVFGCRQAVGMDDPEAAAFTALRSRSLFVRPGSSWNSMWHRYTPLTDQPKH